MSRLSKITNHHTTLGIGLCFFLLVVSCQDLNEVNINDMDAIQQSGKDLSPGRYIITLHEDASNTKAQNLRESNNYKEIQLGMRKIVTDITSSYNIKPENVERIFTHAFSGFVIELSSDQVRELRKDPKIKSIIKDQSFIAQEMNVQSESNLRKLPPGQNKPGKEDPVDEDPEEDPVDEPPVNNDPSQDNAPWNLDRIDQRQLPLDGKYSYGATGSGVTAYIIGGPIQKDHVDFENRVTNVDLTDGNMDPSTSNPLSTETAGVVGGKTVGVAKEINLVGVASFTRTNYVDENEAMISDILVGLDWVLGNASGPSVLLIRSTGPIREDTPELNDLLLGVITDVFEKGIPIFTFTGSKGEEACSWLITSHPNVFSTGMSNKDDIKHWGGNFGQCIDLFAPGDDILTVDHKDNISFRTGNAIVITYAQTAGVAALYLEKNPSATPQQVYDFLIETSTKNVVKLSSSKNNHLLYSRLNSVGAGEIDPDRTNYPFEMMGWSLKTKGNSYYVQFQWSSVSGSTTLDLFENGIKKESLENRSYPATATIVVSGANKISQKEYKLCVPGTNICSNTITVSFD